MLFHVAIVHFNCYKVFCLQFIHPTVYGYLFFSGFKGITNIATMNTAICVVVYRCAHLCLCV